MNKKPMGSVRDNAHFQCMVGACKQSLKSTEESDMQLYTKQEREGMRMLRLITSDYIYLYKIACALEGELEHREKLITKLQQELSDRPVVHREKSAVRRNWVALLRGWFKL